MTRSVDDDQSQPSDPTPLGGEELDPATLAALRGALGDLDFLRSDAALDNTPMPDWAWQRITTALDDERGTAPGPRRGWTRWAGGLVAASVAVLAVGVAVTSFSSSDGGNVLVAEGAPTPSVAAPAAPEAAADLAEPLTVPMPEVGPEADAPAEPDESADGSGLSADLSMPGMLSFAGMVPPAATVLGSQTDYSTPQLEKQVASVLDGMDMGMPRMKQAMEEPPVALDVPLVPASAVQQVSQTLRDCVTRLTQLADSTALLVDWSQVDGEDAGVVVVPEYDGPDRSIPDLKELDIWVIDPECDVRVTVHMSMP